MRLILISSIYFIWLFRSVVLSNQLHKPTVAQQVSINYLNAPKGKKLFARAVCKKDGRTTSVLNINVFDDVGRDVAQFIGTGFKLNI